MQNLILCLMLRNASSYVDAAVTPKRVKPLSQYGGALKIVECRDERRMISSNTMGALLERDRMPNMRTEAS